MARSWCTLLVLFVTGVLQCVNLHLCIFLWGFISLGFAYKIRENPIHLNLLQMCGHKNVHFLRFLIMLVIFLYQNYLLHA